MTMTISLTVTVRDTDGMPKAGLKVYAFTGYTYTGFSKTTDAGGQAVFTLPPGEYRFRVDLNGTQFWSGAENHCTLPECSAVSVTVTIPLTVTVQYTDGTAKAGLPVYAFAGAKYSGYHATTDENGQATFTLPPGDYRFRVALNGTQFWSGSENGCTLPARPPPLRLPSQNPPSAHSLSS